MIADTLLAIDTLIDHHGMTFVFIAGLLAGGVYLVKRFLDRTGKRLDVDLDAQADLRRTSDESVRKTLERQDRQILHLTERFELMSTDNADLRFLTMSLGQDVEGLYRFILTLKPDYPYPLSLNALNEYKQRRVRVQSGAVPGTRPWSDREVSDVDSVMLFTRNDDHKH